MVYLQSINYTIILLQNLPLVIHAIALVKTITLWKAISTPYMAGTFLCDWSVCFEGLAVPSIVGRLTDQKRSQNKYYKTYITSSEKNISTDERYWLTDRNNKTIILWKK